MFEKLFKRRSTLARHQNAPYAEERARYLAHCEQQGYTCETLLMKARELLWVARKLRVDSDRPVTITEIEAASQGWEERQRCCGQTLNTRWTRTRFIQVATPWLRFLGCLHDPVEPSPFSHLIDDFATWMEQERGLASTTIGTRCGYVRQFLRWYQFQERSLNHIELADVDAFLAEGGTRGWSRVTVNNKASALREFFRYGSREGWLRAPWADAVRGPRIFFQEALPTGPSWPDVQRLLASMDTDQSKDVRDRAIMMLFAFYGLRASEVARLRLPNLDWENDLIRVWRAKRRAPQIYPLLPTVGNAIARYLQTVRPVCSYRQVFLSLTPPFRPLSRSALYALTSRRFLALGIQSTRRGPHSLRHACAARLVSEGLSLKEIGDHLGHHSASATRIYAKVDLAGLREVAAFDLGDLL